jgi:hypothetical protein
MMQGEDGMQAVLRHLNFIALGSSPRQGRKVSPNGLE